MQYLRTLKANSYLSKLAKGGRFLFFSGLSKNKSIQTNLINLMHYKEIELFGAYGLTRKNMSDAMVILENNISAFEKLIEKIVSPGRAPELMPEVLSGRSLKFILAFTHKSQEKW